LSIIGYCISTESRRANRFHCHRLINVLLPAMQNPTGRGPPKEGRESKREGGTYEPREYNYPESGRSTVTPLYSRWAGVCQLVSKCCLYYGKSCTFHGNLPCSDDDLEGSALRGSCCQRLDTSSCFNLTVSYMCVWAASVGTCALKENVTVG
jgi:hypothetical protein